MKTGWSGETVIDESATQPEKAPLPIFWRWFGRLIDVSASQEAKAFSPSSARFFGRVMNRRLRHSAKASGPIRCSDSGRDTVDREAQDWKVE